MNRKKLFSCHKENSIVKNEKDKEEVILIDSELSQIVVEVDQVNEELLLNNDNNVVVRGNYD